MKSPIKALSFLQRNPSKLPNFLLLYSTLWPQRLDAAYSPDSANHFWSKRIAKPVDAEVCSDMAGLGRTYTGALWAVCSTVPRPLWGSPRYQCRLPSSPARYQVRLSEREPLSHPHGSERAGLVHSTSLWTTTTSRIADLEQARFPPSPNSTCLGFAPSCSTRTLTVVPKMNAVSRVFLLPSG